MVLLSGRNASPYTARHHAANEPGNIFQHSNWVYDISLIVSEILLEPLPPRLSCVATFLGEADDQQSDLSMSVIGQDALCTGKRRAFQAWQGFTTRTQRKGCYGKNGHATKP